MNKLLSIILIPLFFISCSDDKSTNPSPEPGENSTGNMYAEINGQDFEAGEVKAYHQNDFVVIFGSQIIGNATREINILIRNLNEPRIYAIGEDGNGFIYNAKATLTTISEASDTTIYYGQFVENLSLIDVTDLNNQNITGIFEFRASDKNSKNETMIDVLDGRFNITF